MYNLLSTPIFEVCDDAGEATLTLPTLLALMATTDSETLCLSTVRAHQAAPVDAFLAMLAAHALEVAGVGEPFRTTGEWEAALRGLTPGNSESFWELVHEDHARPAFMQPALVSGGAGYKWTNAPTPDGLDTLISSKNHDVKQYTIRDAALSHWVYALITGQTTAGFGGRDHYGVARMNSGSGSRFFVAAYTSHGLAGRWREEVARLLGHWAGLRNGAATLKWDFAGVRLLALPQWDAKAKDGGASVTELHPGFIEVASPSRLTLTAAGALAAQQSTSAATRVAHALGLKGVVDDPWTPLVVEEGEVRALSPSTRGFGLGSLHDLLFEQAGIVLPLFVRNRTRGAAYLLVRVLCGGNCKTNGYAEMSVALTAKSAAALFAPASDPQREKYVQLYRAGVTLATKIGRAIAAGVASGLPPVFRGASAVISQTLREFEQGWREQLLDWLAGVMENGTETEAALLEFKQQLLAKGLKALDSALLRHTSGSRSVHLAAAAGQLTFRKKTSKL